MVPDPVVNDKSFPHSQERPALMHLHTLQHNAAWSILAIQGRGFNKTVRIPDLFVKHESIPFSIFSFSNITGDKQSLSSLSLFVDISCIHHSSHMLLINPHSPFEVEREGANPLQEVTDPASTTDHSESEASPMSEASGESSSRDRIVATSSASELTASLTMVHSPSRALFGSLTTF